MAAKTLKDLFVYELQDTYSGETQLIKALPKMAAAASNAQLKAGFEQHLKETEEQAKRLEQVAKLVGCEAKGNTCEAMEGLITEGQEVIDMDAEPEVKDAGLIAAAQKVEHYEISGYGTLCEWAKQLGLTEAKTILGKSLDEEKATDQKLTTLAESMVNAQAKK